MILENYQFDSKVHLSGISAEESVCEGNRSTYRAGKIPSNLLIDYVERQDHSVFQKVATHTSFELQSSVRLFDDRESADLYLIPANEPRSPQSRQVRQSEYKSLEVFHIKALSCPSV